MKKRVENKLDYVVEKISAIDVTLGKQSIILEEHIRRTNILEQKIEPVENHVRLMKSIAKIASFVGVGVLLKILHTLVTK